MVSVQEWFKGVHKEEVEKALSIIQTIDMIGK